MYVVRVRNEKYVTKLKNEVLVMKECLKQVFVEISLKSILSIKNQKQSFSKFNQTFSTKNKSVLLAKKNIE